MIRRRLAASDVHVCNSEIMYKTTNDNSQDVFAFLRHWAVH